MFSMPMCATLLENPVGADSPNPNYQGTRQLLKKYSDTANLVMQVQNGLTIMQHKIKFDDFLGMQVDVMRSCVGANKKCSFKYKSFFLEAAPNIDTTGMTIKEQWAVQIIMTRLNLCAIYYAGAIPYIGTIFKLTAESYSNVEKNGAEINGAYLNTFKYFSQGYEPLKRLAYGYETVKLLLPKNCPFLQCNQNMLRIFVRVVECNLGYLKMEKHRMLRQWKECKEAAYALFLAVRDTKLQMLQVQYQGTFTGFLNIAEVFYELLSWYFMLLEHETEKYKHQYGFVRKEFQNMILDNKVAIKEANRLYTVLINLSEGKDSTDDYLFSMSVAKAVMGQVKSWENKFDLNVHENKVGEGSVSDVRAKNMNGGNLFATLGSF